MKKYYAVKLGRKPGVYLSWDECRAQTNGFSGAVYKSFPTEAEAKAFVLGTENSQPINAGTSIYVDGSFDKQTGDFSYGAVVLADGEEYTFSEKFSDKELSAMHNVAGELKGAEFAMRYCVKNGITAVNLYHDYEGIAAWAEGRWKTNKDGTKAYKEFYDEVKKNLSVNFVKVKGHSGDKYNDMADMLAKSALGK